MKQGRDWARWRLRLVAALGLLFLGALLIAAALGTETGRVWSPVAAALVLTLHAARLLRMSETREAMPIRPETLAGAKSAPLMTRHSITGAPWLEGLHPTSVSAIEAIAGAIDERGGHADSHCYRLSVFCVLMGERLGMAAPELEALRLGAVLHDVGEIGVRDEILSKRGRLDAAERAEMERHTEVGHRIIVAIHGLPTRVADCVRSHHERWDGMGYPDELSGEDIPLAARIVSIVDAWDALSTQRSYKSKFPQPKVIEILGKGRGTTFDPALMDLFLEILQDEGAEILALSESPQSEPSA